MRCTDRRGDLENALLQFKKALEIRTRLFGSEHPELAGSHLNIGAVYDSQGRYEEALVQYQQALEVFLAVNGQAVMCLWVCVCVCLHASLPVFTHVSTDVYYMRTIHICMWHMMTTSLDHVVQEEQAIKAVRWQRQAQPSGACTLCSPF